MCVILFFYFFTMITNISNISSNWRLNMYLHSFICLREGLQIGPDIAMHGQNWKVTPTVRDLSGTRATLTSPLKKCALGRRQASME